MVDYLRTEAERLAAEFPDLAFVAAWTIPETWRDDELVRQVARYGAILAQDNYLDADGQTIELFLLLRGEDTPERRQEYQAGIVALAAMAEAAIGELKIPLYRPGEAMLTTSVASIDRATGEVKQSHGNKRENYLRPWLRHIHETIRPGARETYLGRTKTTYHVSATNMNVWQATRQAVELLRTHAVYYDNNRCWTDDGWAIRLTDAEAEVLEALVTLKAATKDELERESRVTDPQKLLARMRENYPRLAPHINLAGIKGKGGYSTTVKAAPAK